MNQKAKANPQEQWQQILEFAASKAQEAPQHIRSYVVQLAECPNVPRNEKKFMNFAKNSLRIHSPATLKNIWDFVNSIKEAEQKDNLPAQTAKAVESSQAAPPQEKKVENDVSKKKKKKKDKEAGDSSQQSADSSTAVEIPENSSDSSKKKKKKKDKTVELDLEDSQSKKRKSDELQDTASLGGAEKDMKKKKKKKEKE